MKKLNYLMGLGLFVASLAASAQTTIYQNGFENADKPEAGKYSSKYALSPGKSMWGDWVNPKDGDVWTEQSTENPFAGEYCFSAENGDNDGNESYSWDRGFKIANLPIKEGKSYRVGFWLKTNGEAKLSSWLSIGIENFDKSICTASGTNFGIDSKTIDTMDEWQHFSFVSYYAGQDPILKVIEGQSWVGSSTFPGEFGGSGESYKDHFNKRFPDEFFFIMNMFSSWQNYYVDDIKIEEDVAFAQATFAYDVIRLDFGYNTNAKELADANGGFYNFDKNQVSVTINGQEAEIHSLEAKDDGYVYVFIETDDYFDPSDKVVVSFTPNADCPLLYSGDKRPSADAETPMAVIGCTNEVAYYGLEDELGNVTAYDFSAAELISTTPENDSFDLNESEIKTVSFNFNKEMTDEFASALLTWSDNYGNYEKPINDLTLSEDKTSIIVAIPSIADGDYKLTLYGAANAQGILCNKDFEMNFSKGAGVGDAEPSEVIWATDFDNEQTEAIPVGWTTYNEAGYHLYGFNEDGSRYTYNYGGNPGGGGTRLFDGFSGDFNKGMYWGTRGTNEGWCTFGGQVADYMDAAGNIDPNMPEEISLYLEPKKYQISFLMAAWKGNPNFTFTLENVVKDGETPNIYAKFTDITAAPNLNGAKGKVTGSVKCQTDFTVDKEGYYVLRFTSAEAQWQEFILANVSLITMPSKSAYYKNMLAEAADDAEIALLLADDAVYDGDTKTQLAETIKSARTDRFTQASVVEALCEKLASLAQQMNTRVENYDQYAGLVENAQMAIDELKESNPDYAGHAKLIESQNSVNNYAATNPSTLNDTELANAITSLKNLEAQIKAIPKSTEILTWGASQAIMLANILGADINGADKLIDDNREVIAGTNANSKGALYAKIAAGEDLDQYKTKVYDTSVTAEEWEDNDPNYDENGHPLAFQGINLSGYIYNAHLYRVLGNDGVPGWTIKLGGGEGYVDEETGEEVAGESINIGYNATPSQTDPVVDAQINIYGKTNYDFSQVIEGLPAGIYNVVLQTRTPKIAGNGVFTDEIIYYNAQDENGTWDKYIYAQGDNDAEQKVTPFAGASGLTTTLIENVEVKDGQLTMGVHEYYVSGVARTWEPAADAATDATDGWLGTSYVDYANLYFVAPLPGFDYAAAAVGIMDKPVEKTVSSVYNVAGTRIHNMQKGINIVKYNDGSVRKLFVK